MGKKSGSGFGMNNPDQRLKQIVWVKILKFFDEYPGWKKIWIGSGFDQSKAFKIYETLA
jgi:hypothetical protein